MKKGKTVYFIGRHCNYLFEGTILKVDKLNKMYIIQNNEENTIISRRFNAIIRYKFFAKLLENLLNRLIK